MHNQTRHLIEDSVVFFIYTLEILGGEPGLGDRCLPMD